MVARMQGINKARGPGPSSPGPHGYWQTARTSRTEVLLICSYGSRLCGWKPLQKLPVCCKQVNCACKSGTSSVLLDICTVSKKASLAMDPPRGSFKAGHIIQGKPCEPFRLRVRCTAHPFFPKSSTSMAFRIIGVPSKSVPFFACKSAKAVWHTAVVKAAGV